MTITRIKLKSIVEIKRPIVKVKYIYRSELSEISHRRPFRI